MVQSSEVPTKCSSEFSSEISEERVPRNIPRNESLGIFRGTCPSYGEEEIWFRWRLEGIKSSGETRFSAVGYGGLVRRRRLGRGGAMRGALTVRISTRVSLQPPRRTRSRAVGAGLEDVAFGPV
ncbi:hypothetical protein F2Q69_00004209 [Brassica cretica]|uniref:Uncharacterized protein n=1 Tax=Brassica cretica TaxID=69181 RepID=A0A8S9PGU8_BRACR|nr:hypothetical protein F2Q69_00004209 [Brassica cretica]